MANGPEMPDHGGNFFMKPRRVINSVTWRVSLPDAIEKLMDAVERLDRAIERNVFLRRGEIA